MKIFSRGFPFCVVAPKTQQFSDLPFTEKEWIIVISAMDSGKGRVLSSEKRIRILYKRRNIQTNNGAPEFLRHKYVAFVQESLPRGQLVAHVRHKFHC